MALRKYLVKENISMSTIGKSIVPFVNANELFLMLIMSLIVHQMEFVLDFCKSTVGSLLFTGSQGFVAEVKPFFDNVQ